MFATTQSVFYSELFMVNYFKNILMVCVFLLYCANANANANDISVSSQGGPDGVTSIKSTNIDTGSTNSNVSTNKAAAVPTNQTKQTSMSEHELLLKLQRQMEMMDLKLQRFEEKEAEQEKKNSRRSDSSRGSFATYNSPSYKT